jgi:hypothetical protein
MMHIDSEILLIDDNPSHAKAFELALLDPAPPNRSSNGSRPSKRESKAWPTRDAGQYFSISHCRTVRASAP